MPFKTPWIRKLAADIASDEVAHVRFLRSVLGTVKVARPTIDLVGSFSAAAQAAGLVKPGQAFNPFADENSFLIGAFLFEDVGVTAYKGAAPLITNKTYLEAAAGILAFEAYHAAAIRTVMTVQGLSGAADAVSNARDSLDGPSDDRPGHQRPERHADRRARRRQQRRVLAHAGPGAQRGLPQPRQDQPRRVLPPGRQRRHPLLRRQLTAPAPPGRSPHAGAGLRRARRNVTPWPPAS